MVARLKLKEIDGRAPPDQEWSLRLNLTQHGETYQVRTSVYRCIERYCMTPRQRDDDNNLSVGNRNHLKLGIEPESWLQSHELGF